MKRILFAVLALILCLSLVIVLNTPAQAADGVAINSTNFPDANFRSYVSSNFDSDKDGVLSESEIAAATYMDVSGKDIGSLTGVGFFTALVNLHCAKNRLESLDLRNNTALQRIDCYGNDLESLRLGSMPKLIHLDCGDNGLEDVHVEQCPALEGLTCNKNNIRSLDLTHNPELWFLNCRSNEIGASLDLSGNQELVSLDCAYNELTRLDLSACPKLVEVNCQKNDLRALNVGGCARLKTLHCYGNDLTALDVFDCTRLESFSCYDNRLEAIDLSHCPNPALAVETGGPETISVAGYSNPVSHYITADNAFEVWTDQTTVINTEVPITAAYLPAQGMRTAATGADADGNGKLSRLEAENVDTLDVQNEGLSDLAGAEYFPAITTLKVSGNALGTLDLRNFSALVTVYAQGCSLQTIDVSACPELQTLLIAENRLTYLDVSQNPKLRKLTTHINQLPELNISSNPSLIDIYENGTRSEITDSSTGVLYYRYLKGTSGLSYDAATQLRTEAISAPPKITTQPQTVTADPGATVIFSVVAQDAESYQWQFKSPGGSTWYDSSMTGARTATLSVEATAARDGQQYRCKVTNEKGTTTSNAATLIVRIPPTIKTQPKSVSTTPGKTVTFTVVVSGRNLEYDWQFRAPGTTAWHSSSMHGHDTATLTVEATAARNGQQYRCVIRNGVESVTSNAAKLTVLSKPAITTQPQSIKAAYGDVVKFTVKATGGSLTYQWQYKSPGSSTWKDSGMTGAKTATLKVTAEKARNGQQYRCVVKNSMGSVTSSAATLTTASIAKPVIQTQPANKTASAGQTVKFTVEATGGSLTYQWQFKAPGTDTWYNSSMTGAKTATLTVEATAGRNGQQYRCIVKNSQGTATSSAAKLTVN